MRLLRSIAALLLFAATVAAAQREGALARFDLAIPMSEATPEAAFRILSTLATAAPGTEFRLESRRESLTGEHLRFGQFIAGREVIGGSMVIERSDGLARAAQFRIAEQVSPQQRARHDFDFSALPGLSEVSRRRVWFNDGGTARDAVEVMLRGRSSYERYVAIFDRAEGTLLQLVPLFFSLDKPARVFDPNPVSKLNDPSLHDQNDSATAVPPGGYTDVLLRDLAPAGPLAGPHVAIVDTDEPRIPVIDVNASLLLDREHDGFEEVTAYHLIDSTQRYLQSLGYVGSRRIVDYALPLDAHALGGADSSYFAITSRGRGTLLLGDGGTDDAEDPDIVLHEYAHAILESVAPGAFAGTFGSEGRAMAEGFSDYWAFSRSYRGSVERGRDPYCLADWDARCAGSENCRYPAGTDCLRRVDSTKTMRDFVRRDTSGIEHLNGEIWSSALRRLFEALVERYGAEEGAVVADRIVVESLFGMPPQATFHVGARQLLQADRLLYGGAHADSICAVMRDVEVLPTGVCGASPRGEQIFFPAGTAEVAIPDGDPAGIELTRTITRTGTVEQVFVTVSIEHELRGDLRIVLVSPDGTPVVLKEVNRSDYGRDLRVTYGRDADPAESLEVLRGHPVTGTWTLHVIDMLSDDEGRVISWGLGFVLEGEEPLTTRPNGVPGKVIPAAIHAIGAADSYFTTDLILFNPTPQEVTADLIFTYAESDGRTSFAMVRVDLGPLQTARFEDAVRTLFATAGRGTIEVRSATEVLAAAEIHNVAPELRTSVRATTPRQNEIARAGERIHLLPLVSDELHRSNVGVAEVRGREARVKIEIYDGAGILAGSFDRTLLPFSGVQLPVPSRGARAVVAVTGGAGAVAAYGSIIDGTNGEPTFALARKLDDSSLVVPLVHANGSHGTRWTSTLFEGNTAPDAEVTLLMVPGAMRMLNSGLAEGATVFHRDFLRNGFGMSGVRPLFVREPGAVIFASHVLSESGRGHFRQDVPALREVDRAAAGTRLDLATVEVSERRRTNVAIIAEAASGASADVVLIDGRGVVVWERSIMAAAGEIAQVAVDAPPVGVATLRVTVTRGNVLAYASVIDNDTGDALFVAVE